MSHPDVSKNETFSQCILNILKVEKKGSQSYEDILDPKYEVELMPLFHTMSSEVFSVLNKT